MNKEEAKEKISKLTERQREVLRHFCAGSSYKEIGRALFLSVDGVKSHMGNIYVKLDLAFLKPAERRKLIHQVFCPLLEEDLPPAPKEEKEPRAVPKEVELVVNEDEYALVPREPDVIKIDDRVVFDRRRRGCVLPIIGGLAIILLILFALNWFGLLDIGNVFADEEPTATESQAALVAATTEAPQAVTASEVSPPPTSEPSLTPRPTEVVLFEDNFEAGLSPEWQLVYGNPLVVNGMLTADRDTLLIVGESSWTDYQVDFDADAADCWFSWSSNYLGVRASNADNMIAYKWADCESYWYVVKKGSWQDVPASEFGPGYEMLHFTIKVQGGGFSVYVDGLKESSFFNTEFTQGKLYLAIASDTLIDNFMVRPVID